MMVARHISFAFGAYLFICFIYVHQKNFDGSNSNSRLDLLHSLRQLVTVRIDRYHTNTLDKALYKDHYYSDKAPGTVFVALPAFVATTQILHLRKSPIEDNDRWQISSWATCAGSVALITAFGGMALFNWLLEWVSPRIAFVTVLSLFLGSAPLPYTTMLFSHSMVIGLISIAMWALRLGHEKRFMQRITNDAFDTKRVYNGQLPIKDEYHYIMRIRFPNYHLAGICCGLALASEFSSGIVVSGVFLWICKTNWRRTLIFILASLPTLILIPIYDFVCFGNPWILPYSMQASFPQMHQGLYAIHWPDVDIMWNLMFSTSRGLFFWTPFILTAMVGYWNLGKTAPRMYWLCYAIPLLNIVVISGRAWDWAAGPTLGPRLLAPIIPLLALPCAVGLKHFPILGMAMGFYSIIVTTMATLTDACPIYIIHPNPLFSLHLRLFLNRDFSPNIGLLLGLSPYTAVSIYYIFVFTGIVIIWIHLPANNQMSGRSSKI